MDLESRDKRKTLGLKKLVKSFRYAIEGFLCAFKEEQNMMIHVFVTIIVIIMGFLLKINLLEWLIVILLIGLVIGTELMNTAIEAVVDLTCPSKNALAKIAKDTAAASVMVFALISAIIGLIIFLPKLIALLK